jgi:hypothetical protein
MNAPASNFLKYIGTPFERYILPIIPAGAEIKEDTDDEKGSTLTAAHLGKIPGKFIPAIKKWVGFFAWQRHRTTTAHLERWQGWQDPDKAGVPIAIGLQTAEFPVVDIDSDDPDIVEAICSLATEHLGWSPARCREESPRRVLCYKWTPGSNRDRAPVQKMRLAFTDDEEKPHVVEILGFGQQVVIEGPHAKGKMHYWLNEMGLAESHGELVDISAHEASCFLAAIREWAQKQGFTLAKLALPTMSNRGPSIKIGEESAHLASNMEVLAQCVRAIDINDDRLADYDSWIKLLVAIKAVCGGEHDFFLNVVWPWLEGNAENASRGIEEIGG